MSENDFPKVVSSTLHKVDRATVVSRVDARSNQCTTGLHPPLQQLARKVKSITERRVPELIPVLGSQPAGDASHKPGGRLPLLSARPAVTLAPLKGLLATSLLGEQRHYGCEQFA